MAANSEETTFSNIKSIIATFWPFVGMAFAFIQFIYARDNAQTAADRAEVKKDVQELKTENKATGLLLVQHEGRIKRVEEKSDENKASVTEQAKRISDVEKTYIYTMPANGYRR